jgi:hypothetical protein
MAFGACTNQDYTEAARAKLFAEWQRHPFARYCHPREEHLMPIMYVTVWPVLLPKRVDELTVWESGVLQSCGDWYVLVSLYCKGSRRTYEILLGNYHVKNMEESLSFYQNIVGLEIRRRMKPMGGTEIVFVGSGDTDIELIRNEKNKPAHTE